MREFEYDSRKLKAVLHKADRELVPHWLPPFQGSRGLPAILPDLVVRRKEPPRSGLADNGGESHPLVTSSSYRLASVSTKIHENDDFVKRSR